MKKEMTNHALPYKNLSNDPEQIEAKVKWYNPEKGYGFLAPDDESVDIFMHFSVLSASGYQHVEPEDRIICEIGPGEHGLQVMRVLEVKPVLNENKKNRLTRSNLNIDLENLEEIEGTIKWYNPVKKFGFVFPDNGGIDIFFHTAILHASGYKSLEPGIRVLVKVYHTKRGPEVRTLTVIC